MDLKKKCFSSHILKETIRARVFVVMLLRILKLQACLCDRIICRDIIFPVFSISLVSSRMAVFCVLFTQGMALSLARSLTSLSGLNRAACGRDQGGLQGRCALFLTGIFTTAHPSLRWRTMAFPMTQFPELKCTIVA